VKEIFDEHCVGCHGPGQDPVLNSYPFDSLFSANQRDLMNRIIQSIKNQRMPPKERPALPPESLARLVDWLNSGLPAE
jgi:mono/diheme cytochrome c family protein